MRINTRAGFTLIELIIFAAIFTVAMIAFVGILVSFTRVQARQSAAAEVNQQSQFLLQTIQRYVEESSMIDAPIDVPTTTLKLRMAENATDPTYIYLSGGALYLQETDGGQADLLNSNKVVVSDLSFVKRANPPAHDSVSVSFTVTYNTQNLQQRLSRTLQSAIARVSAATFDSDIRASSTNTYKIGASAQEWQSINNTIYFNGPNVGISSNPITPQQRLEIDGGLRLNTTIGKPACGTGERGTFWFTRGGGGKDSVDICLQSPTGTLFWYQVY